MRILIIMFGVFLGFATTAQISIDKPVVLQNGQLVQGLANPTSDSEAMNAATVQTAGHSFAESFGINSITCTLTPSPSSLRAGMSIYLAITNTNTDSVSLAVNLFPAVPVLKGGVFPLDSADLIAGSVVQLVFDGAAFQILTLPKKPIRNCLPGMIAIDSQFCIEIDERPAVDFPDAAEVCGNLGGKVCSWTEFSVACHRDTVPLLNDMVGNYEWTDTGANGDNLVRIAGWQNCRSAGTSISVGGTPRPFRCCLRR